MPSIGIAFNTEVEEVPPVQPPPEIPPVPPEIPTPPFFDVVTQWWNSLSTIQKILVVVGVSGSIGTIAITTRGGKRVER